MDHISIHTCATMPTCAAILAQIDSLGSFIHITAAMADVAGLSDLPDVPHLGCNLGDYVDESVKALEAKVGGKFAQGSSIDHQALAAQAEAFSEQVSQKAGVDKGLVLPSPQEGQQEPSANADKDMEELQKFRAAVQNGFELRGAPIDDRPLVKPKPPNQSQ